MFTVLLLVSWITFGMPASNYQVAFKSMESCEKARIAVLQDAERLRNQMKTEYTERAPTVFYPLPIITAVCVKQ